MKTKIGSVLLGGSNGRGKILDITRGHFEDGFTGCIRNVIIQNIEVFAHPEDIAGKNIRPCTTIMEKKKK